MNPLQFGAPASQLSPQNYKNTNQTSGFQVGSGSAGLQRSNSSLLQSQTTSSLRVITNGQPQSVLSATTQNPSSAGGVMLWPFILVFIVSVALTYYFYRRFAVITVQSENSAHDTTLVQ